MASTRVFSGRTVVLAGLVVSLAGAAGAQDMIPSVPSPPAEATRRPYRGLFAPEGRADVPSLDLLFSGFTAYDDDVFATEEGGSVAQQAREGGWFYGISGGFSYNRPGERMRLGALGGASINHYQARSATAVITKLSGNMGLDFTTRTRANLTSTISYSPDYRVSFFSTAGPIVGEDAGVTLLPDFYLTSLASVHVEGGANFIHDFSSRTAFVADASASTTQYLDNAYELGQYGASARLTQRVSRSVGLRLGYGYGVGTFATPVRSSYGMHTIDAGVDFQRDLSISRRTRLAFSTGSAVLVSDPAAVAVLGSDSNGVPVLGSELSGPIVSPGTVTPLVVDAPQKTDYFLTGEARLTHEIYRTWRALGSYRRGVGFDQGLRQPTISQSASARLVGLITRRTKFSAGADYSFGSVGIDSDARFEALTGNLGVTYALTRRMAAFGRWVYYSYEFDGAVPSFEPTLPQSFDRQGVRFGLSLSVPVIR